MTICPAECGQDSWALLPQQTFLVDVSLAVSPLGGVYLHADFCLIRLPIPQLLSVPRLKIKRTQTHLFAIGEHTAVRIKHVLTLHMMGRGTEVVNLLILSSSLVLKTNPVPKIGETDYK